MKRNLFLLVLAALAVISCGGEKPGEKAKGALGGKIVSVAVGPKNPTAGSSLVAEVELEGASARDLAYRWYVNDSMTGEDSGTLPGKYFRRGYEVRVEASLDGRSWVRSETVSISNSPPSILRVALSPDPPVANRSVTAQVEASDPDGDELTFRYRWVLTRSEAGMVDEIEQFQPEFTSDNFVRYDIVQCEAWASDGIDEEGPVPSAPLVVQNAPPEITSTPPGGALDASYTYQVRARDHEGDPLTFGLSGNPPPGMKIDPATGLVTWSSPRELSGSFSFAVEVTDGKGGKATQDLNITLGS